MSDQTEKIQTVKPDSVQEQLRQLTQRVGELVDLLKLQREVLLQRGVNLPPNSLEHLREIRAQLDKIAKRLLDARSELKQLRALAETTALINSSQQLDEVLNQVMDTVIHLTGAERGYIVLKNRETGELEFKVARGMDQEELISKDQFVVSRGIVNQVADTGEAILTDNASQDERWQRHQSIVGFQLRSILAVPLTVKDQGVIGVVYCDNRILAGLFKQHELNLLQAFAGQAAVAIENARLFEQLRAQVAEVSALRARLDNVFSSVASGIITLDSHNRIIVVNTAAKSILQNERIVREKLADILPLNVRGLVMEAIEKVRTKLETAKLELQAILDDTTVRHWRFTISPLHGEGIRGGGMTIVLDDLTEQKEREAQLAEVRRYLPSALVEHIHNVEDLGMSGQEREITAVSCDVRGFTSFSEKLAPEELMRIINEYLTIASDAINLYEGIVDKYLGDAVTGLFNTQLNPQDDHPVRAVQAAMQLMLDLRALHEVLPEEARLFFGVGVHTGMAVLGNVGSEDRKEFAAMGEAMEVSKFLEGNAPPGVVIISQETYERVRDVFECEAAEIIRPKPGFEHITQLYRVVRRKKGAGTKPLWLDPDLLDLIDELRDE